LLAALEGWPRVDFNAGSARFTLVGKSKLRISATKEELEVRCEGGLQCGELFSECRLNELIKLSHQRRGLLDRAVEIARLNFKGFKSSAKLLVLHHDAGTASLEWADLASESLKGT
jgi:hypothetical protein